MIPRYQRILFLFLFGSSLLMVTYLVYLHRHNYAEVKNADNTPIEAPQYSASESVTLDLANDNDGSVTPTARMLALPDTPAVRARALLEHLLAEYALPKAPHSVGGGIAVDDVFLVSLPLGRNASGVATAAQPREVQSREVQSRETQSKESQSDPLTHAGGTLAVVNLRSSWADEHPSGITSETLTIRSIIGTLHTNLPEITKVRFLVDGKPRSTLAGNVQLDRTFDAAEGDMPAMSSFTQ